MDKERKFFRKKNIAVLYGGWSSERDVSLGSGKCVMHSLKTQGFKVKGIDVDKKFMTKLKGVDIAFIALHGKPGEDGLVQGILEFMDIPYTGSGVIGSAIGMDKVISKYLFRVNDIPTPDFYFEDNINYFGAKINGAQFLVKYLITQSFAAAFTNNLYQDTYLSHYCESNIS